MKTLLFIICTVLLFPTLLGQSVLKNPNKSKGGLKEGLWSEFTLSQIIDSTGTYHLEKDVHFTPKNVIAEGFYQKGKREGFWKEYWIEWPAKDRVGLLKGGVKSIIEYKNGQPGGLVVEYYKNGCVRAIGQYETCPANDTIRIQIPDWKDRRLQKMKDTVVYIKSKAKPIGQWHFFKPDGSVWK